MVLRDNDSLGCRCRVAASTPAMAYNTNTVGAIYVPGIFSSCVRLRVLKVQQGPAPVRGGTGELRRQPVPAASFRGHGRGEGKPGQGESEPIQRKSRWIYFTLRCNRIAVFAESVCRTFGPFFFSWCVSLFCVGPFLFCF